MKTIQSPSVREVRISGASAAARSESDIRMSYTDPAKIIAASNDAGGPTQAQFSSTDGGVTWSQTSLPAQPGDVLNADPQVDWTSDGVAWALTLGVDLTFRSVIRCFRSIDSGATWTFDSVVSGAQTTADREILWVDHSPTSPFKDRLYVTWHSGAPVFVARREAASGAAWEAPVQVSSAETKAMGIGGDIKTNSAGDVHVFWPDPGGSQAIYTVRSTDGGAVFSAPVAVAPLFATSRRLSIPASSVRKARVHVSAGAFRTPVEDFVYVVWTDLDGASGCGSGPGADAASACKTRVWFSRSASGGAAGTWSVPVKLYDPPSLNDQFHARLCVDEATGTLVVTYHDTINDAARLRTDLFLQASADDGVTWGPPVRVTSAPTDETAPGADAGQYGDYNGLHGFAGTFFASWTDRRAGGAEEIWTARLSLANSGFTPDGG